MTSVARDSFEAWSRLCAAGGLELGNRDADFGENLRIALSPSAATLEEALRSSSTDHLVRAVFDLGEPFVAMFRAILSFFQAAGVQQGLSQWDIHIKEEHFELKHFEKFLETWNALDREVDVPAVDSDGASAILRAGDDLIDAEWRAKTGVPDTDHWQQMYHDRGLPFPSLAPRRSCLGWVSGCDLDRHRSGRQRSPCLARSRDNDARLLGSQGRVRERRRLQLRNYRAARD
ncbi:hypothetical protein ACN2CC_35290 (plasmid) [Mesorhizobium muleiense]|uniref:hypothetical protein n=1 Tax=Mesorhizobium muleiense TaxID=1004279 RepID=UPI003AFABAB6